MIKSEREYAITKKAIAEFVSSKEALANSAGNDLGRRAALSSIEAQLDDLNAEVAEWERLRAGGVKEIPVADWDDLPKALVRVRIAQGLTQQQLAERLGLKKQQIQRWEDENYEHAELWRVIEVATALGLSLSGTAKLTESTKPTLDAVKGCVKRAGMDTDFVEKCLVPSAATDSAAAVETIGVRLNAIWGLKLEELLVANSNERLEFRALANARFKLPANADSKAVTAQEGVAAYLLKSLCDVVAKSDQSVLPADPTEMRFLLFGNQRPSLRAALKTAWGLGIPVLPLSTKGGFHAACYRFGGRPAIALKQAVQSPARWLFDLVHELGHLVEDHDPTLRVIEPEELSEGPDAEAEARAHAFAAKVLLGAGVDDIFPEALSRARGETARLKKVTSNLATELNIEVGLMAQHVAFRLHRERRENWWGTARNLEAATEAPFDTAREVLLQHINVRSVIEPAQGMLLQLLSKDS